VIGQNKHSTNDDKWTAIEPDLELVLSGCDLALIVVKDTLLKNNLEDRRNIFPLIGKSLKIPISAKGATSAVALLSAYRAVAIVATMAIIMYVAQERIV
jgi:hypothetical protein